MTGFSNVSVVRGGVRVPVEPGGPAGGDLTGSYKDPIVAQIQQYPIDPRSPANGDTLIFNGGEWIPTPSPTSTTYFQGVWDANANTPDIANFPGLSDGFVWIVGTSGNTNVGGITGWIVGDYAVYSGGSWYKLSASSFGWLLTGNNGTNPSINFIGTADLKDLSIRANSIEGLRVYTNGNVQAAADLTIVGNLTASSVRLSGDLAVNGGDITTTSTTFNLLVGATSAINFGNSAATNIFSGIAKFPQGISGSLTRLSDGSAAFIADNGVLITSVSNGPITFKVDETKFAALTGSTFTGPVSFNAGLSGSLTKLTDGTSYLVAGTNMTVVTNSNGSVTLTAIPSGSNTQVQFNDGGSVFGGSPGLTFNKGTNSLTITGDVSAANETLSGDLAVNGGDITTTSTTFNLVNTTATTVNLGAAATSGINLGNSAGTNVVSGTTKFPQGLSGSLTKLTDGTSYLIAGTNMTVVTNSNGSVTLTAIPSGSDNQIQFNDGGSIFGASAGLTFNKTTNSITVAGDITGSNERLSGNLALNGGSLTTTATTFNLVNTTATTVNIGGGATSGVRIGNSAGTNIVSGTTIFPQGLSGSLTKLTDGTSYITQGQNISVTTASNGSINVAFSTTTPTTSDVLVYNGTTWAPSSIITTLQTSYQTVRAAGAIAAGDVCYIVNSGGSNDYPTVSKAQANSRATCKGVIGLATANIANNTTGTVQTYGQLPGPVTTNTFAQGAPLFVSPTVAGGVTDVKPSGPNVAFQIGFVTRQGQPNNVTTGIVFVSPIMQTDTQNLDDLVITAPAEHEVLTYEPATTAWKNKQPLWVPNTQTSLQVDNGTIITAANFANVVYLPLVTQGGANKTLNASTPIASLTKTAVDYGRELWLYNADNNRTISIPSGGNVKLETTALVGGNLVLAPGAIVKFVWTGIGGNGSWIQTSKALVVA